MALLREAPANVWRVPFCFAYELANVLLKHERRGEIARGALEAVLAELDRLKVRSETLPEKEDFRAAVDLARRHRISMFDGLYLLLALKLEAELVTRDAGLAAAALSEGCSVQDARASA